MAKQIDVEVSERKLGNKNLKEARSNNLVPVVIYGKGKESKYGAISDLAFRKNVLAHEHALFSLQFNGQKLAAVVKNLDIDNLNNKIVHADFYEVNMAQEIDATVSIKFVGEAIGIKEGGVMNKALEELHIFCLPSDIPNDIEVDVSSLQIDDRISISDLSLPSNVEILHEPDQTVVAIAMKVEEPEEEVEVLEATVDGEIANEATASEGSEAKKGDGAVKSGEPKKDKKDDKAS